MKKPTMKMTKHAIIAMCIELQEENTALSHKLDEVDPNRMFTRNVITLRDALDTLLTDYPVGAPKTELYDSVEAAVLEMSQYI